MSGPVRLGVRLIAALALVFSTGVSRPLHGQTPVDTDGDGLPDAWEQRFGLDPLSDSGNDGAEGDPDGDGLTNAQELAAGSHPRGFFIRRLAEGASNDFFSTEIALANPDTTTANVLVTFVQDDGQLVRVPVSMAPTSRATIRAEDVPDLAQTFSLIVESDREIAADRTMTWTHEGFGSHAEGSISAPARHWYLAEGATGGPFNLFYLIQNPTELEASVTVSYLLPAPAPPVVRTYRVPAMSRFTIWVDDEAPELAETDVSAEITSDVDIVVERSMYKDADGVPFAAGHASAGVTDAATNWFLAEGATGPFFDLYVLIANPNPQDASLEADYLLPDGTVIRKTYQVAARSRQTIWVDQENPWLANTPVSTRIVSLNDVPVVVERTMWWADGDWYEAHNSPGATTTGTRWLLAGGEVGGVWNDVTYVLLANTSTYTGTARVTLLFEDGTTLERTFTLTPTSRFNVNVGDEFPQAAGRRFGTLVESLGDKPAELVVERSMYSTPGTRPWEAGSNQLAMNLSPAILTLADTVLFRNSGTTTIETRRPNGNWGTPSFSVTSSNAGVARVTIDASTGKLKIVAGAATGTTTVTVTATTPGRPAVSHSFLLTIGPGQLVTFAPPVSVGSLLFPAAADFDGDGKPELVGTTNNGSGQLVPRDLDAIGLGPIKALFPEWLNRENRAIDVNGDGRLDIVTYTYLPWTDSRSLARLFIGQADGTFVEDPDFAALGIRGFGHTIAAADFDNDGDVDLFLTEYTHNDPREQLFLLLNDGQGHFTDVADAAGVALRDWPAAYKVEGVQALDFDGDGRIDIYAASHFFFNTGVVDGIPRFVDRRAELGLPASFDEGIKFLDFDNDGRLDLLVHHPSLGPALHRFDGERFTPVALPAISLSTDSNTAFDRSYGTSVADMNGDGLEDLIFAPGLRATMPIMLNTGSGFIVNPPTSLDGVAGDTMTFADFDGDGRLDIARRAGGSLQYALNTTPSQGLNRLTIEIVGEQGEHNQYGRVVRVTPLQAPGVTYTRVVDGGSGYLAQGQYPILIGTPYSGRFRVEVRFDAGTVTVEMNAGQRLRIFRDGHTAPM